MGERRRSYRVSVGKPEGGSHLEDRGVGGKIILKRILEKWDVGERTESIWLRIGTGGGCLWMRYWIFELYKMRGIYWFAEDLLDFQEGLCSVELIMFCVKRGIVCLCCILNLTLLKFFTDLLFETTSERSQHSRYTSKLHFLEQRNLRVCAYFRSEVQLVSLKSPGYIPVDRHMLLIDRKGRLIIVSQGQCFYY
jgi:hypothetical protein